MGVWAWRKGGAASLFTVCSIELPLLLPPGFAVVQIPMIIALLLSRSFSQISSVGTLLVDKKCLQETRMEE
jgi:hypothetical protein